MNDQSLNRSTGNSHRARAGRGAASVSLAVVVLALVAAAGCGKSKPAYCTDRTNLENAVKSLPSAATSGGVSGLEAQVTTIQNDTDTLVDSAKSDFPNETNALKTSVDQLSNALKALPAKPSTAQLGANALDASSVVTTVKNFSDATKSKCG